MNKIAFAAAAHPDDIEFMMAGTLMLLKQAGYELHYMNVANGSCGSATMDAEQIAAIRTVESQSAAAAIGAIHHEPLTDDIQIYYTPELTARLGAIVRQIQPEIMLLPSPQDYMEDHTNVSRLMVTAAFCRNMRNFPTDPPTEPVHENMAVYHALPYGLQDQLRNPIRADFYVDVTGVMAPKTDALACHRSQKEWLDKSQGVDSYLKTLEEMTADVGRLSGQCKYAEGWRRHLHLGFGPANFDPLRQALESKIVASQTGERS